MNDKLEEFLVAKGTTEELLKKHVVENASDILADKILNGKKNMKGCYNYIKGEAQKLAENGCAMIADAEVYAMAIEYFNNDDIKAEQPIIKAKTTHTNGEVTKEEYAAAKEELAERAKKNVKRAENKEKAKKKIKKSKVPENQVSLFDL